jgi:hypothetical protein
MNHFDQLLDRLLGRGPDEPPCVEQLRCAHVEITAGQTVKVDGEDRTECLCAHCSALLGWMDEVVDVTHPVACVGQRGDKR